MTELEKFEVRFEVVTESGCWLWTGAVWGGGRYGCFRGKESAHKASLRLYRGTPTSKEEHVCHRCDVTLRVNPDHLFVSDHSGNMQDKVQKGRLRSQQKLNKSQVAECIALRAAGVKVGDIAIAYGMHPSTMSRITRGQRVNFNDEMCQ